jgi:thiol-disulfide isomerase/thioredoxin
MPSDPIGTAGAVSAESPETAAPAEPRTGSLLSPAARLGLAALVVCALGALFWPRDHTFNEPGGFLVDASGRAATIGPRLAPITLVHFWATWCPPCIQEIPALQRLSKDFSEHRDFAIVMIAVDDASGKVRNFLGSGFDQGLGAEAVLFDPNWEVANRYGTRKLPETYLVVNGKVIRKFVGMTDWDNPNLRQELAGKIAAGGAPAVPGS